MSFLSFIVIGFVFKFMLYFELIFLSGMRFTGIASPFLHSLVPSFIPPSFFLSSFFHLGHGCPTVLALFVENTIFLLFNCFCILAKKHLYIFLWIYVKVLCFAPLICLLLCQYQTDYFNYVSYEIRKFLFLLLYSSFS